MFVYNEIKAEDITSQLFNPTYYSNLLFYLSKIRAIWQFIRNDCRYGPTIY